MRIGILGDQKAIEPLLPLARLTSRQVRWLKEPEPCDLLIAVGKKAWQKAKSAKAHHLMRGFTWEDTRKGVDQPQKWYITDTLNPKRPHWDWVIKADWKKIPLLLEGRWPREYPKRWICEGDWFRGRERQQIALDVETGLMCAKATSCPEGAQIYQPKDVSDQGELHESIMLSAMDNTLLFHNAAHDLSSLKLQREEVPYLEDTMLLHAVMYPGLPHTLRFLQSVYGQYPLVKNAKEPGLHCWGDVLATIDAYEALMPRTGYNAQGDIVRKGPSLEEWEVYQKHLNTTVPECMRCGVNPIPIVDPTFYRLTFQERGEYL